MTKSFKSPGSIDNCGYFAKKVTSSTQLGTFIKNIAMVKADF